jgi:hypothetical protein
MGSVCGHKLSKSDIFVWTKPRACDLSVVFTTFQHSRKWPSLTFEDGIWAVKNGSERMDKFASNGVRIGVFLVSWFQ